MGSSADRLGEDARLVGPAHLKGVERLVNIIVTDRESIESGIVVRTRYVVISIHDSGSKRPLVPRLSGLKEVHYVQFDNAEPSTNMELPASIKLMTASDAKAVWDFVARSRKAIGTIVVHCEQVMSRSPAVAAAIANKLGQDVQRL